MILQRLAIVSTIVFMLLVGGDAVAQRNGILFLDQQRVVSESKAGQSIDEQLQAMANEAAVEFKQLEAQLTAAGESLKESRSTMPKEQFDQRVDELLARNRGFDQLKQIRQAELQQARKNAIAELRAEWEPISSEIFKKRKGFVLLEKQTLISSDDRGDITDAVLKALDEKVQTVRVVKPDLQGQLIAAAQAQQEQQQQQTQ